MIKFIRQKIYTILWCEKYTGDKIMTKKTLQEKLDYLNELDISEELKEDLIENILDGHLIKKTAAFSKEQYEFIVLYKGKNFSESIRNLVDDIKNGYLIKDVFKFTEEIQLIISDYLEVSETEEIMEKIIMKMKK